jgi:hypothetical protein
VPAQLFALSTSSITRSSATVSWTTSRPATSQVEFGVDAPQVIRDTSLVTSHHVVLTGLTPCTTYRYRVRSVTAGGGLSISPESTFATSAAGSGPEIGSAVARRLTGTMAWLDWSTSSGIVAQVEYGTTANYGAFTLLKAFSSPAQEMVLTDLRPATQYHFRVKAWDSSGSLGSSTDFTFVTAVLGQATLLGDPTVWTERVSLPPGQAAAYQYVATQSGQASIVRLYLDAGTTAPAMRVAVYADGNGAPGTLLSQGSGPGLTAGWSRVSIAPVALVQNTRYWVAVLSPIGGGTLNVREVGSGGSSAFSRQSTLAAFPATWSAGVAAARSPLSVYLEQVPPAVTLTGMVDGAIVNGNVPLSAVVDDDAPMARVQFLVDGLPVGPPLAAAPYSAVWDSTGFSASQPHTISVRATDVLGRSGNSASIGVQVDNGPSIADVLVSAGLTASSAHVSWTTDVPADAQVEFGRTAQYGFASPIDPQAALSHDIQLTGLAPGSMYHYRVKSRDANGAVAASGDQTFTTAEISGL